MSIYTLTHVRTHLSTYNTVHSFKWNRLRGDLKSSFKLIELMYDTKEANCIQIRFEK